MSQGFWALEQQKVPDLLALGPCCHMQLLRAAEVPATAMVGVSLKAAKVTRSFGFLCRRAGASLDVYGIFCEFMAKKNVSSWL